MFVGMDLHKNYLQIAVMDENGKVLENSRIKNNLKQVGRFFDENINYEKAHVVMKSSSTWYNIYSYLCEERHLNVVLSNPIKTRAIASTKLKTDKLDAAKDNAPAPDRKIMHLRELVRHRTSLVRMRTKLKNKIHCIVKILDSNNPNLA